MLLDDDDTNMPHPASRSKTLWVLDERGGSSRFVAGCCTLSIEHLVYHTLAETVWWTGPMKPGSGPDLEGPKQPTKSSGTCIRRKISPHCSWDTTPSPACPSMGHTTPAVQLWGSRETVHTEALVRLAEGGCGQPLRRHGVADDTPLDGARAPSHFPP
jgi:hypothetical protein